MNYLRRFDVSYNDSLKSHLDELIKKHRKLDEEIAKLQFNNPEIRKLKTKKIWYKDEIYRSTRELEAAEDLNGNS